MNIGTVAIYAHPSRTRRLMAHDGHSVRCNDSSVFAAKRPRVSHPPGHAVLHPRGGKTLHHARALSADLSADDFCRPAFDAGLKASLIERPRQRAPQSDAHVPILLLLQPTADTAGPAARSS
jgi:hypothetical protein